MATIPLPIIDAIPIDQARPGVQDLVDRLIYCLNINLTLDMEIASRNPMEMASEMGPRMAECDEHVVRVVDHMLTMTNVSPAEDLAALFMTIMQSFQDAVSNNFETFVAPNGMETMDHLVATVALTFTNIFALYFTKIQFDFRSKAGEFFG